MFNLIFDSLSVINFINLNKYFLLLEFFVLLSAFFVVTVRNPVYSILFLILCYLWVSFLFILLKIEFLAFIILIVYLGAVCVLFLFVIMMLNIKLIELKREINFIPFIFFIFSLICIFFFNKLDLISLNIFLLNFYNNFTNYYNIFNINFFFEYNHFKNYDYIFSVFEINSSFLKDMTTHIGLILYTFFISQFIIASLVLLVAMFGAIFLTLDITSKSKKQKIFNQIVRNKGIF
jgi:NADH:ubiquinone oxidoreductase subunit 6 (subunit J)